MELVTDDDVILERISQNIGVLLAQKGWSQSELGRRIGSNNVYISRLRNQKMRPTIGQLVRIAEAFEVSIDELVGRQIPALTH